MFPGSQPDDHRGRLSPWAAAVSTVLSVHTCLSVLLFFLSFNYFISSHNTLVPLSVYILFTSHFLSTVFLVLTLPFSQGGESVGNVGYLFGYFNFKIYAKLQRVRSKGQTMTHYAVLSVKGLEFQIQTNISSLIYTIVYPFCCWNT